MNKKMIFSPEGARLLVQDIVSELSLEQRAEKMGLAIVVNDKNRPRATMGTVVAVGEDPILYDIIKVKGMERERYRVGDVVTFSWHAGVKVIIEDEEFRSLELSDIIGCFREVPEPPSSVPAPSVQSLPGPYPTLSEDPFETSYQESSPSVPDPTGHSVLEVESDPNPLSQLPLRTPEL